MTDHATKAIATADRVVSLAEDGLRGAVSADDTPPLREALEAFLKAYGSQDSSTGGLDKAADLAREALSHTSTDGYTP